MRRSRSKPIDPSCGRHPCTTRPCEGLGLRRLTTWTSSTRMRPAGSTGSRKRSSAGSHARRGGLDGCSRARIGMSSRCTSARAIRHRTTFGRTTIRDPRAGPQASRRTRSTGSCASTRRSTKRLARSWTPQAGTKPKSPCSVTTGPAAPRTKCCTSIAYWPSTACCGFGSNAADMVRGSRRSPYAAFLRACARSFFGRATLGFRAVWSRTSASARSTCRTRSPSAMS